MRRLLSENEFKKEFVNSIAGGTLLLVFVGLPASLSRLMSGDMTFAIRAHIIIGLIYIAVYLNRKRVSTFVMSTAVLLTFYLVAIVGPISYGIVSTGFMYGILASIVITGVYGLAYGIISLVSYAIFIIVIAHLFIGGTLNFDGDMIAYSRTISAWSANYLGLLVISMFIMYSFYQNRVSFVKLNKKINFQATHDALTGIYNFLYLRDYLISEYERAVTKGNRLVLLYLDLDGFKYINDNYGHEVGDELLKAVSKRLKDFVGKKGIAARYGGDEFTIVCPHIDESEDLDEMCSRLLTSINSPIQIGDYVHEIGVSIGVSVFRNQGESLNELRQMADDAMYMIKNDKKNGYKIMR